MIQNFKDRATLILWETGSSKKLPAEIWRVALRKLWQIHHAEILQDLKSPPNNRLEALKGDRAGQYGIRINQQWRLCFLWKDGHAFDLEIIDYH